MKNHRLHTAILFALLVSFLAPDVFFTGRANLHARDRSPGRPYFEQAYEAEKKTPSEAIELYKRSIAAGLKPELVRAARWRLFYLYRKAGDYGEALSIAAHLGSDKKLKNVLGDLYKEIAAIYKVPEPAAREYAIGLKLLARNHDNEATIHFERALRGNNKNEALRRAITNRLIRRGDSTAALALLKKIGYKEGRAADESAELARADLLVKLKRDDEARRVLLNLSRTSESKSLDDAERSHLLYLLARVARRSTEREAAVHWFRLAAISARSANDSKLQSRMQGLASYELFRGGHKLQARALLYGVPETDDPDVNLLELVLRADVDREEPARRKLRSMAPNLKRGKRSFLVKEALRLAAISDDADTKSQSDSANNSKKKNPIRETRDSKVAKDSTRREAPVDSGTADRLEFWHRDFRKTFGERVKIPVPKNHRVLLVRNPDRLQFHGYSRSRDRLDPRLEAPLVLPENLNQLSDLLRGYRGDFVLLIAPNPPVAKTDQADQKTQTEQEPDKDKKKPAGSDEAPASEARVENQRSESRSRLPKKYRLARINENRTFSDQAWLLVNLHSDGAGNLLAELEEVVGPARMPGYARGVFKAIEVEFAARD